MKDSKKFILFNNLSPTIYIKFEFPEEGITEPKTISVDQNDLLEIACDKLLNQLKSTKFPINSKHYFYLKKNNKREKEIENRKIYELCLNEEDVIFISYKKLLIPFKNSPFFYSNKDSETFLSNNELNQKENIKRNII